MKTLTSNPLTTAAGAAVIIIAIGMAFRLVSTEAAMGAIGILAGAGLIAARDGGRK